VRGKNACYIEGTEEKEGRAQLGRKRADIDPGYVQKLAEMGCTIAEIASFFGCHRNTLNIRFEKEIRKGQASGKIELRRMQMQAARRGNVRMLIHLGKALLGQSVKSTRRPPQNNRGEELMSELKRLAKEVDKQEEAEAANNALRRPSSTETKEFGTS
jgi:hypothetical protein